MQLIVLTAEFQRARRASGAPQVRKSGNPSMREILVLLSAYVRPSVRTYVRTDSGGAKSQGNLTGGENAIFTCGRLRVAFGQLAFLLAENHKVIVGFEKEVSLKAFAYLAKQLFHSTEVFNLRKK